MKFNQSQLIKVFVSLVLVSVLSYFGVQSGGQSSSSTSSSSQVSQTTDVAQFNGKNFEVFQTLTKIPASFVRVVDGDTIIVKVNGHEVRTRYLMVDTPESVKEGLKTQPYGKEAAQRNEQLLKQAKQVYLAFDKGEKTDDYGRALAYVYADDQLVSEQLVKEGLASVSYVNPPNNSYEALLREAQTKAKNQKLAIWSIKNYVNDKGKFKIQE